MGGGLNPGLGPSTPPLHTRAHTHTLINIFRSVVGTLLYKTFEVQVAFRNDVMIPFHSPCHIKWTSRYKVDFIPDQWTSSGVSRLHPLFQWTSSCVWYAQQWTSSVQYFGLQILSLNTIFSVNECIHRYNMNKSPTMQCFNYTNHLIRSYEASLFWCISRSAMLLEDLVRGLHQCTRCA